MSPGESLPRLAAIAGVFLLGAATPGPNFVFLSAQVLRGRSTGLAVAAGFACAALTWASATVLGPGLLFATTHWLYRVVQWCGGGYLTYIGLRLLLTPAPRGAGPGIERAPAPLSAFARAYWVNMLNPKSAAFYSSIFASMMPPSSEPLFYFSVIVTVSALSFAWYAGLAIGLSHTRLRTAFRGLERGLNRILGAVLASLGVKLVLSR
jgi:threonine/homoserine/homoserine lactone efflux protein